jgi:hypothetical protein
MNHLITKLFAKKNIYFHDKHLVLKEASDQMLVAYIYNPS